MRKSLLVAASCLVLAVGCGGDDEDEGAEAPVSTPATQSEAAEAPPAETTSTEEGTETATSPEDEQGGAGDEEPIRSEAVFTCSGSAVTPRRVQVPAFIAIEVRLAGSGCTLEIAGRMLSPGDSAELDGLPPQERYSGSAGGTRVQIVPGAEPGP